MELYKVLITHIIVPDFCGHPVLYILYVITLRVINRRFICKSSAFTCVKKQIMVRMGKNAIGSRVGVFGALQ